MAPKLESFDKMITMNRLMIFLQAIMKLFWDCLNINKDSSWQNHQSYNEAKFRKVLQSMEKV